MSVSTSINVSLRCVESEVFQEERGDFRVSFIISAVMMFSKFETETRNLWYKDFI